MHNEFSSSTRLLQSTHSDVIRNRVGGKGLRRIWTFPQSNHKLAFVRKKSHFSERRKSNQTLHFLSLSKKKFQKLATTDGNILNIKWPIISASLSTFSET